MGCKALLALELRSHPLALNYPLPRLRRPTAVSRVTRHTRADPSKRPVAVHKLSLPYKHALMLTLAQYATTEGEFEFYLHLSEKAASDGKWEKCVAYTKIADLHLRQLEMHHKQAVKQGWTP